MKLHLMSVPPEGMGMSYWYMCKLSELLKRGEQIGE